MLKKSLTVDFVGFWPNFIKNDNYFYHLLSNQYDIYIKEDNPDLLFFSVDYSKKYEYLNPNYKNSKKIFYTGENTDADFNFCDAALTFSNLKQSNHYRLPLWVLHINWFNVKHKNKRDQSFLINKEKLIDCSEVKKINKQFCSFIATNNSGERLNFAKQLNNYKKINSSGKLFNNTNKIIKGRGDQKWKIKYLANFRFNIAFENQIGNGYVTEKIVHPMAVNSIPIYWGSDFVIKDFNLNSFIYVEKDKSFESVINEIKSLESSPELYLKKLNEPWFKNYEYPDYVLPKNVLNFINQVLFN